MSVPPIKSSFRQIPLGTSDKRKMSFRVSNFLITMNTNVRFADDLEAMGHSGGLYTMGEAMFRDAETVGKYVLFPKGGQWDGQHIVSVDSASKVEVGHNQKGRRLHLHATVKIRHHSFIQ